jgi:hypothetical protein
MASRVITWPAASKAFLVFLEGGGSQLAFANVCKAVSTSARQRRVDGSRSRHVTTIDRDAGRSG